MKTVDFPRILEVLSTSWDTSGGLAMRRLIWSLYGACVGRGEGPVEVHLWNAVSSLDEALRLEFSRLVALGLNARDNVCRALLEVSGEWDRIDHHPLFET